MKKLLTAIALMAIALIPTTASATPLTIGALDPYYLGSVDPGSPASPADEVGYINQLLSMATPSGPILVAGHTYVRSNNDCIGCPLAVVADADKVNSPSDLTGIDVSDFVYLLAKYGNVSYVWYVADLTSVDLPATLPGGGISHYSLYNNVVPDGGATAGLLGLAMLGLGYIRRRMA